MLGRCLSIIISHKFGRGFPGWRLLTARCPAGGLTCLATRPGQIKVRTPSSSLNTLVLSKKIKIGMFNNIIQLGNCLKFFLNLHNHITLSAYFLIAYCLGMIFFLFLEYFSCKISDTKLINLLLNNFSTSRLRKHRKKSGIIRNVKNSQKS